MRFSCSLCATLAATRSGGAQTSPIPAADYTVARGRNEDLGSNNGWGTLALEASGGRPVRFGTTTSM